MTAGDADDLAIQPHVNRVLAWRLQQWSAMLHDGRPPHESALTAGLPRMFGVLLAPGFAVDGTGQALRFLARYYRDRNERLLALLRAAITPLTTLLLGSMVLLLCLGLFRTIVALVNAVDPMIQVSP